MVRECKKLLKAVSKESTLNIITTARGNRWKTKAVPLKKRALKEARAFLDDLRTRPERDLHTTLVLALEDPEVDTIFLFSDGLPYGGRIDRPEKILEAVRARNRQKMVRIHVVGLLGLAGYDKLDELDKARHRDSQSPVQWFLKRLAEENQGTYFGMVDY